MLKKLLPLFLLIILVTGCTVKYDLEIDENTFNENISFSFPYSETTANWANEIIKTKQVASPDAGEDKYYSGSTETRNNKIYLNYKYSYKNNDFNNASILDQCFKNAKVIKQDGHIELSTGEGFTCFYRETVPVIDKAEINITTKLKVKNHNADKVKNNTYTWYINKDNSQTASIYLDIKLPTQLIFGRTLQTIAIIGGIFVLALLIFGIVIIRKKRNNKF